MKSFSPEKFAGVDGQRSEPTSLGIVGRNRNGRTLVAIAALLALANCAPRAGRRNVASVQAVPTTSYTATAVGTAAPVAPAPIALPGIIVSAAAPNGIDSRFLGVPLDIHFTPFQGAAGATLYPGAPVVSAPMDQMDHGVIFSEDSIGFDANVSAWGFLSVGAGAQATNRFASYRARQIERVEILDDRVAARAAPPGTVFYPWKIYYGHSFEAVLYGSTNTFHAGIKAKLSKQLSGGAKAFADSENLDLKFAGVGLKPKNADAIFAFSQAEITESYSTVGPAVPIFVEYRSLPGSVIERKTLPWARSYRVQVSFQKLDVGKDGAAIFTPSWQMTASCALNGKAQISQTGNNVLLPPGTKISSSDPAYPLSWSHTFPAVGPADQVSCSVEGAYTNKMGTGPLPKASTPPISLNPNWPQTGEFVGANAAAKYSVSYTVTVTENAQ